MLSDTLVFFILKWVIFKDFDIAPMTSQHKTCEFISTFLFLQCNWNPQTNFTLKQIDVGAMGNCASLGLNDCFAGKTTIKMFLHLGVV